MVWWVLPGPASQRSNTCAFFRRKSANRRQIIHALERAVRLQHLQDRDKWIARSNARAQRVIEFGLAEEGRLLLNLRAIADDDDLHVGRV